MGDVGHAGGAETPKFQYAELLKIIVLAIDVYLIVLHKLWEAMVMASKLSIRPVDAGSWLALSHPHHWARIPRGSASGLTLGMEGRGRPRA